MLTLKLFAIGILLTLVGLGSSENIEGSKVQIINQPDFTEPAEPSVQPTEIPKREGKRRKDHSPNVHIENIYIPHQIQKGEETIEGYPMYPIYTHPLTSPYDRRPSKSKHKTKPKPSPTETQIPEDQNQEPTLNTQQKPLLIYRPDDNDDEEESPNDFIKISTSVLSSIQPQLSVNPITNPGYPYFIIINAPNQRKSPQSMKKPKPKPSKEEQEEDVGEADHSDFIKPLNSQIPLEVKKPLTKSSVALRKSHPRLKSSKFDANTGFSIAKYLMGYPSSYGNQGWERSIQNKNDFPVLAEDDTEDDEESNDMEDEALETEKSNTPSDNVDKVEEANTEESENTNAFQQFQQLINGRGNKLPVDYIFGSQRPKYKIDDRIALVFLRHSKRGRQLLLEEI